MEYGGITPIGVPGGMAGSSSTRGSPGSSSRSSAAVSADPSSSCPDYSSAQLPGAEIVTDLAR